MEKKGLEPSEETRMLSTLARIEALAEKKTKIYSRLLTEPALAKEMERISLSHETRKNALLTMTGVKPEKKAKGRGMDALNEQEEENEA